MSEEQYKEDYEKLKTSGMMWEFYPEFSGNWEDDRNYFIKAHPDLILDIPRTLGLIPKPCNEANHNETSIAKLRNYLSPILNYFYLMQVDSSEYTPDVKQKISDLKDDTLLTCFEYMDKIKELVKEDKNWI